MTVALVAVACVVGWLLLEVLGEAVLLTVGWIVLTPARRVWPRWEPSDLTLGFAGVATVAGVVGLLALLGYHWPPSRVLWAASPACVAKGA